MGEVKSSELLLGRKAIVCIPLINMQQTGMRIKQIIDERKISVKQVQEYLNLSCVQTVYHWLMVQAFRRLIICMH